MERSLYLIVAVLQFLAFGTIMCKINVEREKRELSEDDLWVKNSMESMEGFLDVPVWFAEYSDEKGHRIYRRELSGKYAAKTIMEFGEFSVNYKKTRRNVNETADTVRNVENSDIETSPTTSSTTNVNEISVDEQEMNDVYHPSILLIINHNMLTPKEDDNITRKQIIYATAFWHSVDLRLRQIKNPRVRLSIAGFIIASDAKTVPYLSENIDAHSNLDIQLGFDSMMEYWRNIIKTNEDFNENTFDIVAIMTNYTMAGNNSVAASSGPPCLEPNKTIAGLLFEDKQSFEGIELAVKGIAKILGAKNDGSCPSEDYAMADEVNKIDGREWSQCTLDQISTTLKTRGSCLKDRKEIQPPGKPLKIILPGMLMSANRQCNVHDFDNICEEKSSCDYLYCTNDPALTTCKKAALTLDGTACDEGKICLGGKCFGETIISS